MSLGSEKLVNVLVDITQVLNDLVFGFSRSRESPVAVDNGQIDPTVFLLGLFEIHRRHLLHIMALLLYHINNNTQEKITNNLTK